MTGATVRSGIGRRVLSAVGPPLAFLIILIAIWELALAQGWVDEIILPRPWEIVTAFVDLIGSSFIWEDIWATSYETIAGFLLASVFGIGLAVASGLSKTLREMLRPFAISLQVTPRIAIAPVVIAWVGFGYSSKVVIAALVAFFPVYVNTLTGILTVDEDSREMFRSLGASRRQTFTHLMLPSSTPVMFAGLKTAMSLALIGAVVGEFISAEAGLGVLVQQFSYQLAVADAFAVILMLTLIGLILYGAMEWIERATVFWLHDNRLIARSRRRAERYSRGGARWSRRGRKADVESAVGAGAAEDPVRSLNRGE